MRLLYHHPLVASARKVRLVLHEKRLTFDERVIEPWKESEELLGLTPAGQMPVLVDENETVVSDHGAIIEYLDEVYPEVPVIGRTPVERAEARRLAAWFDDKFHWEVTQHIAGEKLTRRVSANAAPDSRALRAGRENIQMHMQYITWLQERRSWLAGDMLSIADLAAAANISLVDYSGDVPWEQYPEVKEWYVRMKSRPSFRALLKDAIPGVPPAPVYTDLDF